MSVLLSRLRQAGWWAIAAVVGVVILGCAVLVVVFLRGKRRDRAMDALEVALEKATFRSDLATARAAVEIAAARAQEGAEKDELLDILRDHDEDRQAERLLAEMKRQRGK